MRARQIGVAFVLAVVLATVLAQQASAVVVDCTWYYCWPWF